MNFVDPVNVMPWSSDWLWSLPLSVLTVVIQCVRSVRHPSKIRPHACLCGAEQNEEVRCALSGRGHGLGYIVAWL
jgi:hypothetical protein